MATKFKVKRSTVSGVSPTTGDIDTAELAINLPDRKLFTSNGTAVYELGSNLTNLSVSANLNIGASGDIVLAAGAGISANGSLGTAGHVLHSNGTSVYWAADDQGVTSVATGNGLTGGTITSTGTVSVLANNGITANTTGLYVTQGTGTVVNTTGVHVNSTYIGTLTANNATNLNGQPASYYTNATNLASGTVPTARLGSGTANSTTFLSGDQSYKTAITSVATGSGLTGGTITTTGTVSVLANNGLSANATGVYVVPGNGLVTANSTGVHVGAGSGISVNSTAVAVLANSGVVANATGVYVNTTYIATLAANSSTGSLTNTFTVGTASYFVANGNLGIGNTTPAHKLRVQGDISLSGGVHANGSLGTAGQVLTSNSTGVYWSTPTSTVNTSAQYVWTNTHTFQNTVTFSTANAIILPVGNTASRPAASNGMIRYNTNTGLVEVVANTTWTGVMAAYSSVREQFTASNNQTTFTVTGGYVPGQVDVYYNGVKLRNGTEVTVSSGSTVVLDTGAANGALVEVVGTGPSFVISNTSQIAYQQFTATSNQTTFTVTNGYVPGLVDVYVDGVKMVNGTDVNVSSGSNVVLTTGIPNGSIVEVKGYSTPLVSTQSTTAVRQTFTANSTVNNNFTVTGGYIAGQVDVYYNGAKLVNGTDVNTSSGTTIVLTSNAASGAVIDVVGINYYTAGGGVTTPVRQTFIANSTVNTTFTVASGYSPGQIDVYKNGIKLVPGTGVNVSSGSTITLSSAAANGDTVEVVGFSAVAIGDAVRKSGDTMTANLIMGSNSSIQVNNLSIVSPADTISVSANLSPATGNTYDLGSTSARWRNIYTNDLNLSNGLGDYTIVEGEDDLFLYNNKKGKVYKFALIEVKAEDAPKKIGD